MTAIAVDMDTSLTAIAVDKDTSLTAIAVAIAIRIYRPVVRIYIFYDSSYRPGHWVYIL